MPKQKQFLSAKKKAGKQTSTSPETANEYLAVGVDFEEAGEKWRAGDATKSTRFFVRAIDNYEEGLQKFPHSFDLAYNKARLQYELAQQPRLITHVPTPLLDLLRLALDSHRVAMRIGQDNADLLFNTAQVLTSLAEATSEGKGATQTNLGETLHLFQEALELFQRCLGVQEFQLIQQATVLEESSAEGDIESTGVVGGSKSETSEDPEDERWATIVEPVTKDTLLDTALAQLEMLTAVCALRSSQELDDLAWVNEYYHNILRDRIARYVDGTERHLEAALTNAKFTCALLDVSFRSGQLDVSTYERELSVAFNQGIDLSNDPHSLCDKADIEILFITSVQASVQDKLLAHAQDISQLHTLRWKHLTMALDHLAAAAKLPQVQNLPRIHLRRGDCELLRYRLAEASYDMAVKGAATVIKNAEVYYRGSARLARYEGAADEEREASVKEAIVVRIAGNAEPFLELVSSQRGAILEIVEEMRDEGLLSHETVALISSSIS